MVKLPEAKKGFVFLPKRWVVEGSFAWTARFRRLARDFERTLEVLRELHFIAFAILNETSNPNCFLFQFESAFEEIFDGGIDVFQVGIEKKPFEVTDIGLGERA